MEIPPETIHTVSQAAAGIGTITLGTAIREDRPKWGKGLILGGGATMAYLAYQGGEPRYLLPEGLIVSTATIAFIEEMVPAVQTQLDKISDETRLKLTGSLAALIIATLIATGEIDKAEDLLAPLGLSGLGMAFSLKTPDEHVMPLREQQIQRFETVAITSTIAVTVGAIIDSVANPGMPDVIVPGAFALLNFIYLMTLNKRRISSLVGKVLPKKDEA